MLAHVNMPARAVMPVFHAALAVLVLLALVALHVRGDQDAPPPPVVSCGLDRVVIREMGGARRPLVEFDPPTPLVLTFSTMIDGHVSWSSNLAIEFEQTLALGANVTVHRESLTNPPIASWLALVTVNQTVNVEEVSIRCDLPVTFFIRLAQDVNAEGRVDQCDYRYRVTFTPQCTVVAGDPQFAGLRGQSYQVHGIDGAVYALISAPTYAVNSRFDFLDGPRPCPIMPSTGRHSMACWAHPGSYLGVVGVRTVSGAELVIQAGRAAVGFASVTLNGKELPIADRFVCAGSADSMADALSRTTKTTTPTTPTACASSSTSRVPVVPQNDELLYVARNNTHELMVRVGEFELTLENNDAFINLRAVRVSPEDWHQLALKHVHGLLGQTWQVRRFSGAIKEIEGEVDDYVIEENHVLGHHFVFSRYTSA